LVRALGFSMWIRRKPVKTCLDRELVVPPKHTRKKVTERVKAVLVLDPAENVWPCIASRRLISIRRRHETCETGGGGKRQKREPPMATLSKIQTSNAEGALTMFVPRTGPQAPPRDVGCRGEGERPIVGERRGDSASSWKETQRER